MLIKACLLRSGLCKGHRFTTNLCKLLSRHLTSDRSLTDALVNPRKGFLMEAQHLDIKPLPEVTLSNSNTQLDIRFRLSDYGTEWHDIIGSSVHVPFNLLHWSGRFMWLFGGNFWPPMYYFNTFYRALHCQLSDEYLSRLRSIDASESILDATDVFHNKINYRAVGSTSSTSTVKHALQSGLPIATTDHVLVTIDTKTRKSAPLDPAWKANVLRSLEESGTGNDPVDIPSVPELEAKSVRELKVIEEFIDHNKHTNVKIYMLGSYATIQSAIKCGELELCSTDSSNPVRYDNLVVKEFVSVFEKETNLGDVLRFELLVPVDSKDELYVQCYNSDIRVAYCQMRYILL